jgi:hypothetical protein
MSHPETSVHILLARAIAHVHTKWKGRGEQIFLTELPQAKSKFLFGLPLSPMISLASLPGTVYH